MTSLHTIKCVYRSHQACVCKNIPLPRGINTFIFCFYFLFTNSARMSREQRVLKLHIVHAWVLLLKVTKTNLISRLLPTFLLLSTQVPAVVPAPPPAAIFIPSRGTVLQAMGPLPVRPPVPVQSSLPALAPVPPRPPQPPVPGSVRCSGCSKVLL